MNSYCVLHPNSTHFMYSLERVFTELESEVQEEQYPGGVQGSQVPSFVDSNSFPKQDNPRCITPILLGFSFNHYLYVKINCALTL
jgi:hypothetical protein